MNELDFGRFEESLGNAEEAAFRTVCDVLDLTVGVNAFIGFNRGKADCMVFDIGSLQTGDLVPGSCDKFHFRGSATLYNRDRRKLQAWLMRLAAAFPAYHQCGKQSKLRQASNVEQLRLAPNGAIPSIETDEVQSGTNQATLTVYSCTVVLDIVFKAQCEVDL